MADSDRNQVRIKVILDSDEAKGKLAELQGKIDELFGRGGNGGGAGSVSTGGTGGGAESSQPTPANNASQHNKNGQEQARGFRNQFQKDIPILGKLMGGAIGGMVTKMLVDGIELTRLSGYHPGESQYWRNRQLDATKGALTGGVAGLAGGMMIGGPLGALIGGIGGMIYGALKSTKISDEKQRIFAEQTALNLNRGNAESDQQFKSRIASMAFARTMSFEQSREKRIGRGVEDFKKYLAEAQKYQEEAKLRTEGKWNPHEAMVYRRRNDMWGSYRKEIVYDKAEDGNSENVKTALANAEQMKNSAYERLHYAFEQKYLAKQISQWEGSDFAKDAYAQRGITIGGAGFDITNANEPIIKHLADISAKLSKFAELTGRGNQMSVAEMFDVYKMLGLQ